MAFYAVGDIHGEVMLLRDALSLLRSRLTAADRTIFLGDYIDRGEDSRACVDLLIAFGEQYPKTIFLRGNHEAFLLAALRKRPNRNEIALWLMNGGTETLDSYGVDAQTAFEGKGGFGSHIPARHRQFFESTRLEYKTARLHFVHAGLVPEGVIWEKGDRNPRLWIRDEFIDSAGDFGRVVVFGHTPQGSGSPLVRANKVGIDTAAVFGGALSVVRFGRKVIGEGGLPAFELFQFKHRARFR